MSAALDFFRIQQKCVMAKSKVFEVEHDHDTLIVVPQGDSLQFQEWELEESIFKLHDLFDELQIVNLVVDLGNRRYLGSIVIGAIMALSHKPRDRGGQTILCNASDSVREVMQVMKIDTVMPYVPTQEEALVQIRGR